MSPRSTPLRSSVRPAEVPGQVECTLATVEDAGCWDEFVRERSDATAYHYWGWQRVFERALRCRPSYLIARRQGHVAGVLPLVEMRSRLFGRALSSLPYVNYGGIVASDREAAAALFERASAIARERALSYVLLRHRERLLPEQPVRAHKVTMKLALAADCDAMWNALDRKVRNQIRKAEKSGLTHATGGLELLDDFFAIFSRNMRDLGTPTYGRDLFEAILQEFPRAAALHVVRLDGASVAAALSYADRDWIEVPSASSLREHRALCPNHLLYWEIIKQAIADGRRCFDFGRSTPGDGTYHFKEQWGAAPEPLHWEYHLEPGVTLPSDDRHSSKFHAVIEAWKRLPLPIATLVGPAIARRVP